MTELIYIPESTCLHIVDKTMSTYRQKYLCTHLKLLYAISFIDHLTFNKSFYETDRFLLHLLPEKKRFCT